MIHSLLIVLSFAWASPQKAVPANHCAAFEKAAAGQHAPSKLKGFLKEQWSYLMREFPEWATYAGYPGQNARWTDQSREAIERRKVESICQLATLKKIKRTALNDLDRTTLDLAIYELEMTIEGDQFGAEFIPVSHMDNLPSGLNDMLQIMPAASARDFEDILKRLENFPTLVSQTEILMREGLKRKIMPVKIFMPKMTKQIDDLLAPRPEDSALFAVFKDINGSFTEPEKEKIRNRAKELLTAKIYPSLKSFRNFIADEYGPHGREAIAWSEMPNGKTWYEYRIRKNTTTQRSADDLHQTGLSEVARITAEMETIRKKVNFSGDLKAFNKHLMTDKQFQHKTPDEILAGYRSISKRIDPELPKLFRTLPRLTYGVRAMPEFKAKTAPGGMYTGGSLEAGRPGWFEANTYDVASNPKWHMETLVLHEAVPGHHFQIAIAKELNDLPEFRRNNGYTAFDEGWALYAESLGREIGFFSDAYSEYGHLTAEMLRAVRLVVDTGMHAKGWSREKALAFYLEKVPSSELAAENEINRYITWPGQALGYKVGQMKIRSLRDRAQASLADRFDVREFHDQVLKSGSLPMDILEKNINAWISAQNQTLTMKKAHSPGTVTK